MTTKRIKNRCNIKIKKCITRKIQKYKPVITRYSRFEKNINITNKSDIDKYFSCYKINNLVKKLCYKWILLGGSCNLDYSIIHCGTVYLSKTKRASYHNHIHIFPMPKDNSFSWYDKKSKNYGYESGNNSIDTVINSFMKLL